MDDCYKLSAFLDARRVLRVLDIGAHVGCFALRIAELCPRATIECYEPSPTSFSFLRDNIVQNRLQGRVQAHPQAVTSDAGPVTLADSGSADPGNRIVGSAPQAPHTIQVESVPLYQLLAQAYPPFDVVKLDCEGSEYPAILNSSPDVWRSVQRVVLEYHPVPDHTWNDLAAWFRRAGYVERDHVSSATQPGLGTVWLTRDA